MAHRGIPTFRRPSAIVLGVDRGYDHAVSGALEGIGYATSYFSGDYDRAWQARNWPDILVVNIPIVPTERVPTTISLRDAVFSFRSTEQQREYSKRRPVILHTEISERALKEMDPWGFLTKVSKDEPYRVISAARHFFELTSAARELMPRRANAPAPAPARKPLR